MCGTGGVVGSARPLALWPVPIRDVGHCRHDFSGQSLSLDDLVSGHVACNQPKERHQRVRPAAGFGLRELQNRLGLAAQTTSGDGPSGPRGDEEAGVKGRRTEERALIVVAAEENGPGIGRIRLRCLPDLSRISLHGFITQAIEPGSTVRTDGLNAYRDLHGYVHDRQVQRRQTQGEHLLPRVHRVISLLKRWLMGTHQGAIGHEHLDDYLNEFVFRFNRRTSASRGKLFYRLAQQAVQVDPVPFAFLIKPQSVGSGGVK